VTYDMFAVHQRASANYSPGGSPERTSLSLAHQGAFHPGSGFVRRCEQGRVAGIALAETGFQVPAPLVLRVMALAIEADDHGGELIISEDKVLLPPNDRTGSLGCRGGHELTG
jgi:hypothetical protein